MVSVGGIVEDLAIVFLVRRVDVQNVPPEMPEVSARIVALEADKGVVTFGFPSSICNVLFLSCIIQAPRGTVVFCLVRPVIVSGLVAQLFIGLIQKRRISIRSSASGTFKQRIWPANLDQLIGILVKLFYLVYLIQVRGSAGIAICRRFTHVPNVERLLRMESKMMLLGFL